MITSKLKCQLCNQVFALRSVAIHNHIDWCSSNQKRNFKLQDSTYQRMVNAYRASPHIVGHHYSAHTGI